MASTADLPAFLPCRADCGPTSVTGQTDGAPPSLNADQVVGQLGMVTQRIDNLQQTGRVSPTVWTGAPEAKVVRQFQGMPVEVRIDGVKLIVRPVNPFRRKRKAAQEMQAPPASQGTTSQLYTAPICQRPRADTDISLHREE